MTPATRQALLLTLTVWLVFVYGSYAVAELISGRAGFLHDLPLDLPAVLLVALLAFGLYPFVLRTAGRPPMMRWTVMLSAAVMVAFAQSLVNMVENRLLGVIPALDIAHLPLIRERFGRNFLGHIYLSIATGALFIFLVETRRAEAQRVERLRAETLAADARTAVLSLQMNPHFLFNALNAVSSLILSRDTDAAEAMVGKLADFLRRTLKRDPSTMVSLGEEFATVAAYLEIEAIRFEERMILVIDCPEELKPLPVLPFLLQPLAENAVKYGVARSRRPVTVRVTAAREAGMLALRVEDDAEAKAAAAPGLGIGLNNIAERLAARYGARASVRAAPTACGFMSEVRLPLGSETERGELGGIASPDRHILARH